MWHPGVWGGLFSTFDCAIKGLRNHKEDPWNSIIAGFFTGGALAIRGGYKAARNGAIGCAVLLAVIEGVGIGFQKMLAGATKLEVCLGRSLRNNQLVVVANSHSLSLLGSCATPVQRKSPCLNTIQRSFKRFDLGCTKIVDYIISLNSFLPPAPSRLRWAVYLSTHFMTVSILGGGVPCNIETGLLVTLAI
jgi:hypothetical protein